MSRLSSRFSLPPHAVAWTFLIVGCDIRDEQPRVESDSPWLEAVARRIEADATGETATGSDIRLPAEPITDFASGARRAAVERLPLLLVFQARWCRWSGEVVETLRSDARLSDDAGRFVCATVDADHDAAVCRSFGVTMFPTVIVLDETGRERFRATGRGARRNLSAALAAALDPGLRVGSLPDARPGRSSQ